MRQPTTTAVERVRGMNDVPPALLAARRTLAESIVQTCAQAGYALMDYPIIESTELFLRKAGEERVQQMYAFRYRNRDLCLRPEFTASVVRAMVATMQSAPSPVRVAYHGPVFRYERPGQARYRQFTEVGIELLGAGTAAADAEVIGLAVEALRTAGLHDVRLVLGHVGVVRGFLAALALDERVRDWLVWSMERLRPDDERGERIHPALSAMLEDDARAQVETQITPPDRDAFLALLREAGISLEGNRRSPEEIAEGLIRKVQRRSEGNDVRRALNFLRRLVLLRGPADVVLPDLEQLLQEEQLPTDAVDRMKSVLDLLEAYGVTRDQIVLDLGLGRGLHYYTGVLFEMYGEGTEQLGGGGRYDDLASILGARQAVPAVGFSLGVERVHDALNRRNVSHLLYRPTVAIGQGDTGDAATAIRIARDLRRIGWTVLLDVRERKSHAALKHAQTLRADVYAEPIEQSHMLRWRPLNGDPEIHIPLDTDDYPVPPDAEAEATNED